jgi:predicted HNH restriction endonuclease
VAARREGACGATVTGSVKKPERREWKWASHEDRVAQFEKTVDNKFRNANGVYMKLCNFLRLDPSYKGAGLQRGGKSEKVIWNEFAQDHKCLSSIATAIRNGSQYVSPPKDEVDAAAEEEEEFPEGRILTQLHKRRERNPKLVQKKRKRFLKNLAHYLVKHVDLIFLSFIENSAMALQNATTANLYLN